MATFFNQASLSYRGGTVNSNVTAGEIVQALSASKTAVIDTYAAQDTVTYAIQLINAGATPLGPLTVTDDLGAYPFGEQTLVPLRYVEGSVKLFYDGVLQAAPAVTAGPPLTVSGITVPANGEATVLYAAQLNEFAPPDAQGTVVNTATVQGAGITPVSVSETISAQGGADLSITKSLSPTEVAQNGQITYTFVIENRGNAAAVAADELVLSDLFDPALSDIAVTYNGTPWTEGNEYTYDQASGQFTTAAGAITVDAATYTQDPVSGAWTLTPGTVTLAVTGTI